MIKTVRTSLRPAESTWTSGPGFVSVLHGVRGFAIATVVMYHLAGATHWVPRHAVFRGLYESAFLAVDVLFFTTGFVLFLPVVLRGTLGNVAGFAIRRWARLAPAYYVCLVVVGVLMGLLSSPALRTSIHLAPQDYLAHFAFVQWELLPHDTGFIVDRPVWTLSIDVCFYVLLPLIATRYLRRPLIGLVVAIVIAELWRRAFSQLGTPAGAQDKLGWLAQFPLFFGDFAAGMTAAWAFVRLRDRELAARHRRALATTTVAALAGLLVLAYIAGTQLPFHLAAYQEPAWVAAAFPLCLATFVVAIALMPAAVQWPLTNRAALGFAEISYSVYLYHLPLMFFALFTLHMDAHRQFPLTLGLVVLPALLVISTISCRFIERPGRRFGRWLAARVTSAMRAARASASGGSGL